MMRRWMNRLIEWGGSENNTPINEDVKYEKVSRLFQNSISGQTPSPWFMV